MEKDFHVGTASRRSGGPKRRADVPAKDARPPTLLALPSYLAGNVARIGHRSLLAMLQREGLRLSHHAVLAALADFGALAQHELSDRLDVDRSHMVGFVDRLEEKGYVKRTRDTADRRRVLVSLTAAGRRAERRITAAAHESQEGFLSALSKAEQRTLLALLSRVLEANDADRLEP